MDTQYKVKHGSNMQDVVSQWTPTLGTQKWENRLENALRRALGSVRHEIRRD